MRCPRFGCTSFGSHISPYPSLFADAREWSLISSRLLPALCVLRLILLPPLSGSLAGMQAHARRRASDGVWVARLLQTETYEASEAMYICPSEGKVSCIFALAFRDGTDGAIAEVFLKVRR